MEGKFFFLGVCVGARLSEFHLALVLCLCSCFSVQSLDHTINARKKGTSSTGTLGERQSG